MLSMRAHLGYPLSGESGRGLAANVFMAKASAVQGTGSIWSKRRQKTKGSRDGGGKQRRKRGTWGSVHCEVHGIMPADGKGFRSVSVPIPANRTEKYKLGCPFCAAASVRAKVA